MSDINYLDPEQFNNVNDKLDFKFILMRQIDKCRVARSTEMRGGYYEIKPISIGGGSSSIEVYIPDTRETYISSIQSLKMLLITYVDEIYRDKEKELEGLEYKEIENKRKLLKEKYSNNERDFPYESFDDWKKDIGVNYNDIKFELLLQLCKRAKLIGGNNLVTDEV